MFKCLLYTKHTKENTFEREKILVAVTLHYSFLCISDIFCQGQASLTKKGHPFVSFADVTCVCQAAL
jgi:hypothetical protein